MTQTKTALGKAAWVTAVVSDTPWTEEVMRVAREYRLEVAVAGGEWNTPPPRDPILFLSRVLGRKDPNFPRHPGLDRSRHRPSRRASRR